MVVNRLNLLPPVSKSFLAFTGVPWLQRSVRRNAVSEHLQSRLSFRESTTPEYSRSVHFFLKSKKHLPSIYVKCYGSSFRCVGARAHEFASGTSSNPAVPLVSVGDVVCLSCDSIGSGGEGVCRLENGTICFVHRALPGEKFWARVTSVSKKFVTAIKTETLTRHAEAVEPVCSHFGPCGGCSFQSLKYKAQLEHKRQVVVEALRRIGKHAEPEAVVLPVVSCDNIYSYRNKVEFSFSTREWAPAEGCFHDPCVREDSWVLGFHRPGHHDQVLHIDRCHLQGDAANRALEVVQRTALALGLSAYDARRREGLLQHLVLRSGRCPDSGGPALLAELTVSRRGGIPRLRPVAEALAAQVPEVRGVVATVARQSGRGGRPRRGGAPPAILHGSGVIAERILGLTFEISTASFFQTNPRQAEVLYAVVAKEAQLDPRGGDVVLDLYCGTGTIGLSLAHRCREVHGFELVASAVQDARRNAERNGIRNARFYEGDLERIAQSLGSTVPAPDVVVADPARSGMAPRVVSFLRRSGARRVVYVSCNAATQMRDVAMMAAPAAAPGEAAYRLLRVTPVDMFPQTPHVETVGVLERVPPGGRADQGA